MSHASKLTIIDAYQFIIRLLFIPWTSFQLSVDSYTSVYDFRADSFFRKLNTKVSRSMMIPFLEYFFIVVAEYAMCSKTCAHSIKNIHVGWK